MSAPVKSGNSWTLDLEFVVEFFAEIAGTFEQYFSDYNLIGQYYDI